MLVHQRVYRLFMAIFLGGWCQWQGEVGSRTAESPIPLRPMDDIEAGWLMNAAGCLWDGGKPTEKIGSWWFLEGNLFFLWCWWLIGLDFFLRFLDFDLSLSFTRPSKPGRDLRRRAKYPKRPVERQWRKLHTCHGSRISPDVQASLLEYEELCNEVVLDGNGKWCWLWSLLRGWPVFFLPRKLGALFQNSKFFNVENDVLMGWTWRSFPHWKTLPAASRMISEQVLELQAELRAGKIEVGCAVCPIGSNWAFP